MGFGGHVPEGTREISANQGQDRGLMRAGLRLCIAVAAVGLALGGPPAFAQNTSGATNDTAVPETVGPRELQNFSLEGRVTRPAEPAPETRAPAPPPTRTAPPARTVQAPPAENRTVESASAPRAAPNEAAAPEPTRVASAEARPDRASRQPSTSSITVPLPAPTPSFGNADATLSPAAAPFDADSDDGGGGFAAHQSLSLWPWLLAAMVLGAGAAFLLWRRNSGEAFAGGPQVDAFVAPPPAPAPRPRAAAPPRAPAPAPLSVPKPAGLVSPRLRPWVDFEFRPLRCVVEDDRVRFEFELDLFNSGSAPARDVLIEAKILNASPEQDREITDFFTNPVGKGERLQTIAPLKRITLRPQVVLPRNQVRVLDVGGRRVFVPLLAFNSLYRWGGTAEGQTSAAYLLGRETKAEKLAPFRMDLGARVFRDIGSRLLPSGIRK